MSESKKEKIDLQLVKLNETVINVAKDLAKRQKLRRLVNITSYQSRMIRNGVKINYNDFKTLFKDLEDMNVGKMTYGRNGNPDWFNFYYAIGDIGKSLLSPTKDLPLTELEPINIKGVVKRVDNIVKHTTREQNLKTNSFNILMVEYQTKNGDKIPVRVDELESLLNDVKNMQSKLNS